MNHPVVRTEESALLLLTVFLTMQPVFIVLPIITIAHDHMLFTMQLRLVERTGLGSSS